MGLGPELIVNGTFDTDLSGWGPFIGEAVWDASGKASFSSSSVRQLLSETVLSGTTIRIAIDVSDLSAPSAEALVGYVDMGGATDGGITATEDGSFETTLTLDVDMTFFQLGVVSGTGKIDNVSVRQVFSAGGVNVALIDALNGED